MNTQKAIGIGLTALLATVATLLAKVPGLTIVGPLILAIVIGMIVGNYTKAAQNVGEGIAFSSKVLLRAGIILLGLRLNFFCHTRFGYKWSSLCHRFKRYRFSNCIWDKQEIEN